MANTFTIENFTNFTLDFVRIIIEVHYANIIYFFNYYKISIFATSELIFFLIIHFILTKNQR